jgi:hypothetical protein
LGHSHNQKHIEDKLSKLGNHTADIVLKIRKKFEAGEEEVALKRGERDAIRKFIFIMRHWKPLI